MEEARKLFGPHRDAILDFDWCNSLAVSGDKSGIVAFWDINEGVAVFQKKVGYTLKQVIRFTLVPVE